MLAPLVLLSRRRFWPSLIRVLLPRSTTRYSSGGCRSSAGPRATRQRPWRAGILPESSTSISNVSAWSQKNSPSSSTATSARTSLSLFKCRASSREPARPRARRDTQYSMRETVPGSTQAGLVGMGDAHMVAVFGMASALLPRGTAFISN